jgi:mannan endo-1,4-beta-mannosidase
VLAVALVTALMAAACSGGSDVAEGGGGERRPPRTTEAVATFDASTSAPTVASTAPSTSAGSPAERVGPPARAGTGAFEVVGTEIFDPEGYRFVPVGTNMNGPNAFFDVPTAGKAAALARGWGFNTIRLVTCLPQGCHGTPSTVNNDLDAIVAEYAAQRIAVILDYHQLGFGAAATPAELDQAVAFWEDMARRYRSNPYVWFNLFNEPESTYQDYLRNDGTTAPQRWRDQHQRVIDAVRLAGATNVIVIDDTQAGQGAADWWKIGPSPDADSGIISEGRNLFDPAGRLVFSVHAYDVWGFPNDNDRSCATRYTDEQRDARFRAYVQRVHSAGQALMVGEVGFRVTDRSTSGVSFHGEAGIPHPPCGSTTLLAAETVYRVAPEFDLGVLAWHGFPLTTTGAQDWTLTGTPPTNLTAFGKLHYDFARKTG